VDKALNDACNQSSDAMRKGMAQYNCKWDAAGGGTTTKQAEAGGGGDAENEAPAGNEIDKFGGLAHFDVSGYYATAEAHARQLAPDAEIMRIDAEFVSPDGKANLTLGHSSTVLYRFRSPSKSKLPAGTPIGAESRLQCIVYVYVSKDMFRTYAVDVDAGDCTQPVARAPACSVEALWKKAVGMGAPSNAVSSLTFEAASSTDWFFNHDENGYKPKSDPDKPSGGMWKFGIRSGTKDVFSHDFQDDCKP
jgi:hypothetical protein